MPKFVFTYSADYDNYDGQEIREAIITFLHHNGATNITQCLETTFVFDAIGKESSEWYRLIQHHLDGPGNFLEHGFYLLNKVLYSTARGYEIFQNCDPDLQDFVDEVILRE